MSKPEKGNGSLQRALAARLPRAELRGQKCNTTRNWLYFKKKGQWKLAALWLPDYPQQNQEEAKEEIQ
jgi:hypothetical protein